MRIAFDVKGTLDGHMGPRVRILFLMLEDLGHEMFVWSNSFSYAVEAIEKHGLKATPLDKFSSFDAHNEGKQLMDLCVEDDRMQDYLGARGILFVDELGDSDDDNMELLTKKLTLWKTSTEEH